MRPPIKAAQANIGVNIGFKKKLDDAIIKYRKIARSPAISTDGMKGFSLYNIIIFRHSM